MYPKINIDGCGVEKKKKKKINKYNRRNFFRDFLVEKSKKRDIERQEIMDLKRRELNLIEQKQKMDEDRYKIEKDLKLREIQLNLKREEVFQRMIDKYETK